MKKRLLLIVIIAFAFSGANAQILSEDFESTAGDGTDIVLTGWTNSAEVGTRAWQTKSYSNLYAQLSSYGSGEVNQGWLITPSLTLDGTNDFSFDVNIGYWTHVALTVFISTDFDGSNIAGATWTDITSNFSIPTTPTVGYGTFATAGTMSLSSYTGTAYIAFVYDGDDTGAGETTTVQIDNILVTGTVSVSEINSNLSIYPNPATSVLNINSDSNIKNIAISNVIGQRVMNVNDINANNYNLNVRNLTNGVYLINIENIDGTSSIAKFVKK
ncbi:MAG: choice-of-anchor J domain-containing protein [Bacteroidales bacterium]|nr:choice-of-anchor J domain-containing protein [Bacteroidales bacterium]